MEVQPNRAMRRKDREITDSDEIGSILASAKVMHLALSDKDMPFLVPLFYAYDGSSLFFHSANAGTKIEILRRNPKVCFSVSIDHGIIESDLACDFEARHRTVIGFGTASFIESEEEKIRILDRIVGQFTSKQFSYPEASLRCTAVVRIAIGSARGKKHGF
jgi:nitroimidazol reductase NimA-like FMN-containing flavoprotein (pyridoxamine 5'-phosphate oxidase superfamily)